MTTTETRPALALRDYQSRTVDAVFARRDAGVRRQLCVLPTGAGKTVIFSHVARRVAGLVGSDGRPAGGVLVLAHRDELLNQAIDKLRTVWPDAEIGKVRGQIDEHDARDVVVASIQTVSRDARLARLAEREWSLVIVDEAHHAPASTYTKVLNATVGPDTLLLGVTATPTRLDGQAIGQVFDEIPSRVTIDELVAGGYLVDCKLARVDLDLDLRDTTVTAGDYQAGDLGRRMASAGAHVAIANAYQTYGENRPAVVYVPTVDLAHETARQFVKIGIPAMALSGDTSPELRDEILKALRSGEIRAVVNCMVLTEGWDEPCVSCVVVARPTRSASLYTQMVGRGLRLHPDKSDCLVIDVSGAERDPAQMTLADLGGDGELLVDQLRVVREMIRLLDEGRTLTEARREATERFGSANDRKALAPTSGKARDAFRWLHDYRGRWILALGDKGSIVLLPKADGSPQWLALHLADSPPWEHHKAGTRELARGVDLGWAQGIAEELVRRYGTAKISGAQVAWRDGEASDGQLGYAKRLGIPLKDGHNRGELSDLIQLATVSRRFDKVPAIDGAPLVEQTRQAPVKGSTSGARD